VSEEQGGFYGFARTILAGLPPAFVMLCLINVLFLGLALRFIEHQVDVRTALVGKIIENCLKP
jgi:uncharacterized membrane-anchored protein YitT (DUF2179 family)